MSKDVSSRKSCDAEIGRVGARVQQGDRGQLGRGYTSNLLELPLRLTSPVKDMFFSYEFFPQCRRGLVTMDIYD